MLVTDVVANVDVLAPPPPPYEPSPPNCYYAEAWF
jgi:hypothetical protein